MQPKRCGATLPTATIAWSDRTIGLSRRAGMECGGRVRHERRHRFGSTGIAARIPGTPSRLADSRISMREHRSMVTDWTMIQPECAPGSSQSGVALRFPPHSMPRLVRSRMPETPRAWHEVKLSCPTPVPSRWCLISLLSCRVAGSLSPCASHPYGLWLAGRCWHSANGSITRAAPLGLHPL